MLSAALCREGTGCSTPETSTLTGGAYAHEEAENGKVLAEYIWLGETGADLCSRTIVLESKPDCIEDLPIAEIDGSTYGQAPEDNCELYLQPRKIFSDPFRGSGHILVLCDVYVPPLMDVPEPLDHLKPHPSNRRPACEAVMEQAAASQPMFSFAQGYSLEDTSGGTYFGTATVPVPMPKSATAAAASQRLGREIHEMHMRACLKTGLSYSSGHAAGEGVWSYKLGPGTGLELADQLCLSRFLLIRTAEQRESLINFSSDPLAGGWGGSGCTIEFSTAQGRQPGSGIVAIQKQLALLQANHAQHVFGYGGGGIQRLLMKGLQDCFQQAMCFSVGVGNKKASVMVPTSTVMNKCGAFVDRRAPGDVDPYLAALMLTTTCLDLPFPADVRLAPTKVMPCSSPPCSADQLPSSQYPTNSCATYSAAGAASMSRASDSVSFATENTEDVLISELDKIDQFAPNTPPMDVRGASMSYCDDACSETCSDACSPPTESCGLASSLTEELARDLDMFFE